MNLKKFYTIAFAALIPLTLTPSNKLWATNEKDQKGTEQKSDSKKKDWWSETAQEVAVSVMQENEKMRKLRCDNLTESVSKMAITDADYEKFQETKDDYEMTVNFSATDKLHNFTATKNFHLKKPDPVAQKRKDDIVWKTSKIRQKLEKNSVIINESDFFISVFRSGSVKMSFNASCNTWFYARKFKLAVRLLDEDQSLLDTIKTSEFDIEIGSEEQIFEYDTTVRSSITSRVRSAPVSFLYCK